MKEDLQQSKHDAMYCKHIPCNVEMNMLKSQKCKHDEKHMKMCYTCN